MDNHDLRAMILKVESRLSEDDRKRLHFFLRDDVPQRFIDDLSLSGTLNLIDSLITQDIINENNVNFLIDAFYQIRCFDAVRLLKGTSLFSNIKPTQRYYHIPSDWIKPTNNLITVFDDLGALSPGSVGLVQRVIKT
jgi:hypothetical protein